MTTTKANEMLILWLVEKVRAGDNSAFDRIWELLNREIRIAVGRFYIAGKDNEDRTIEAKLGLWQAIKDWDGGRAGIPFAHFAVGVCIPRRICTEIQAARRQKHAVLNDAMTFEWVVSQDSGQSLFLKDVIVDKAVPPLEAIIIEEELGGLLERLRNRVTVMQGKVLEAVIAGYTQGEGYPEMAIRAGLRTKQFDNALKLLREKAHKIYAEAQAAEAENEKIKSKEKEDDDATKKQAESDVSDMRQDMQCDAE